MTGRRVQGLKMGQDGKQERTEARFPNLIDQMKVVIAQSALQKAQANYDRKYKELDEKLREENLLLHNEHYKDNELLKLKQELKEARKTRKTERHASWWCRSIIRQHGFL